VSDIIVFFLSIVCMVIVARMFLFFVFEMFV